MASDGASLVNGEVCKVCKQPFSLPLNDSMFLLPCGGVLCEVCFNGLSLANGAIRCTACDACHAIGASISQFSRDRSFAAALHSLVASNILRLGERMLTAVPREMLASAVADASDEQMLLLVRYYEEPLLISPEAEDASAAHVAASAAHTSASAVGPAPPCAEGVSITMPDATVSAAALVEASRTSVNSAGGGGDQLVNLGAGAAGGAGAAPEPVTQGALLPRAFGSRSSSPAPERPPPGRLAWPSLAALGKRATSPAAASAGTAAAAPRRGLVHVAWE